jgi:DNA-binding protein H-NS
MDLNALSLKELKELQARVTKAVATFEDRRKKEALAELEDRARQMGFNLSEFFGAAPARKRAPAVAKYANPANPADTWSGRGRKPRWFEEAVKAGKSADDLTI